MQFPKGQGALEYLLLIGGAVVVAAIVVVMLLGFGRTGANQANATFQQSLGDIYGDGGAVGLCGNGIIDESEGEECDCDQGLQLCTRAHVAPLSGSYTCSGCKIL